MTSLLEHMNKLGISDGISGNTDLSVDGLPLKTHLDKGKELLEVAKQLLL